jgi:hypothetical protein
MRILAILAHVVRAAGREYKRNRDAVFLRRTFDAPCDESTLRQYAERIWPGKEISLGRIRVYATGESKYYIGPGQADPLEKPGAYYFAPTLSALQERLRARLLDKVVCDSLLKEGQ